jgi:hypothetical protein
MINLDNEDIVALIAIFVIAYIIWKFTELNKTETYVHSDAFLLPNVNNFS